MSSISTPFPTTPHFETLLEAAKSAEPKTIELTPSGVRMIDQTVLPKTLRYVDVDTPEAMVTAIRDMIVRGAPAIGIAGAYGVVLSVRHHYNKQPQAALADLKALVLADALSLRASRPTAVNLMWAIDALLPLIENAGSKETLLLAVTEQALQIHRDDLAACVSMGEHGAALLSQYLPQGAGLLTHCNAGGLATAGYGTALGVIRSMFARDNGIRVYADETRPRLQGAKLTAWELAQDKIPVTLICDSMAATLMRDGLVHAVLVGADRIATNGDAANKIGTYSLSIVAKAHQVPFYVVAPCSSFDMAIATGADIPIEHRDPAEVSRVGSEIVAPQTGIEIYNPAFDVTPASLISAIITEKGVALPDAETGDFTLALKRFFNERNP
ncbi:MAG: S-methyl-5-thioribose-1-phosphate isomerase [Vampirovibrionales bacterium]|nr:S-methyl-5-thioribose-1-phosphate isomerase [Vampirovibrionales bacterium]